MNLRMRIVIFCVLMIALIISGCSNETNSSGEKGEGVQTGGTLNIAYPTQPQTIDPHETTAEATRDAAKVIYESLVTLDNNYQVIPQLADSYEINEDGTVITFKLRENVKFHNGELMEANDVIASMKKWGAKTPELGEHEWKEVDKQTVELHLKEPSSLTMYFLADVSRIAAIMPMEIADSAGPTGATEYIGTGPFKFVEWKQDEVIKFEKFADYQSVSTKASGLGGKKEAIVDALNWNFVPDSSTRVNGLMSGQYDFAHMLNYDSIPQVESTNGVEVDIWSYGIEALIFNKKEGLFSDIKARQAVNYALDMDEIMGAAFVGEDYYELDSALFLPSQTNWYSEAGKDKYNQKDPEKAKEMLKEAGYNGEEIVILTSRDYEHHYNAAVATQQELEKIGMNVKLDVYDWPTLLERRDNPSAYDIFFTGFSTTTTPNQYVFLNSETEWAGWTNSPEIDQLLEEIRVANEEDIQGLNDQLHEELWEYLPVVNLGKNSRVSGYSEKISGYTNFLGPNFWNVSKGN
ncbi:MULTISPECIES: ABC transporter substrate-binding protein [Cytobacillus]|uniref:ABC transporter substrate-binding protein n=1 Tax=Cytobacillus kochii TaxID=859143 RepID=A0A248TIW6_9BACI|nr:ABC transporter substrate-binding protein [Cytobacillus kochii]ASV68111.1 ABC transporter substrate-binding protein [Cytobacillus kochii]